MDEKIIFAEDAFNSNLFADISNDEWIKLGLFMVEYAGCMSFAEQAIKNNLVQPKGFLAKVGCFGTTLMFAEVVTRYLPFHRMTIKTLKKIAADLSKYGYEAGYKFGSKVADTWSEEKEKEENGGEGTTND